MNATPNAILTNFLLGSELFDSISFNEFKSFFPTKYQSAECIPQIRSLHALYENKRTDSRKAVKRNILHKCKKWERRRSATKRAHGHPITDIYTPRECAELVSRLAAAKQNELAELTDQLASLRAELHEFSKQIESVDLGSSSNNVDQRQCSENIQELIQSLE